MYRFGAAVEAWDAAAGEAGKPGHFPASSTATRCTRPGGDVDKSGGQIAEQLIHVIDLARRARYA